MTVTSFTMLTCLKKKKVSIGEGRVFSNLGKTERPEAKTGPALSYASRRRAFTLCAPLPVERLASERGNMQLVGSEYFQETAGQWLRIQSP